ncbi:hypothetical protein E2542_SST09866 [Spatholobus suberectus]|nr:hypothetical protein E2542_SST09866 [Spatholobus suberectus]
MLGATFFKTWDFRITVSPFLVLSRSFKPRVIYMNADVVEEFKANMVAMRGRGDRFNGILVRFNKKAILKMFLGPVF